MVIKGFLNMKELLVKSEARKKSLKIKVTVGMCVKNSEATIKEAIESIVGQDFPHELMEIIFIDDGSEDATLSIILSSVPRMDMQVKVFHSAWEGLGPARNAVVDNAQGEYIVWVDGDMILPNDHVVKQVEFMEQNPTVAIAGGSFQGFSEDSVVVTLENLEWQAIAFKNAGRKLGNRCHICGGGIYRVSAIKQVGGFDSRIKGSGEDEEIECRVTKAGWSVFIGTPAIFYEKRKKTWKALWNEAAWYGYGGHYLLHKKKAATSPSIFFTGLLHSLTAYRLTHRKVAFLLPIQYYFKKLAWFFGFLKAHMSGYGHE